MPMDNSDSSDDEHDPSGSKTSKLQIDDVAENDEHSADEQKNKDKDKQIEVIIESAPVMPVTTAEIATKSTKKIRKRRTTSSTSRKRRSTQPAQPRIRNPNPNPRRRERVSATGLNGNYWNAVQVDRHSNRPNFDRAELLDDEDEENDITFDDQSSTSDGLIKEAIRASLQQSSSTESEKEDVRPILYENRSFVTCRSPADSFFLCQILQNVYADTKTIRIRWCAAADEKGDEAMIDENTKFRFDYEDTLDPQTILTAIPDIIRHPDKTLSLRKNDIFETNRLLEKSIKGEPILTGETKTTGVTPLNDQVYETASNDEQETSQKPKRRKIISDKTKKRVRVRSSGEPAPVRKRRRTKDIAEVSDQEKHSVQSKRTTTKPVRATPKAQLFKVQSNRFLKENNTITIYRCEPFFEDDKISPFISSLVEGKLAIRAVLLDDRVLLQSLIDDVNRVCSVHVFRSIENNLSAIHYAIKMNRVELLKILLDDLLHSKKERCPFPQISMLEQSTGTANIRILGFRTAKIMASRGAREGNNALTKDRVAVLSQHSGNELLLYALKNNCSREIYDVLIAAFPRFAQKVYENISICIRAGHRKLAASLIEEVLKNPFHGFNVLHHQSLLYDHEEIVVKQTMSVTKKAKENFQLTPIHCASINPNSKYLKQFLSIMPEYNILDKYERRPIHYAASCEGPEPLEYLLSRHVNFNDVDRGGNSPLHLASSYGRAINVEILLRTAKEKAESNDSEDQIIHRKFGLASINRMNKSRQYPLHLAVINNHLECVKVLLEFDAQIDVLTSTASGKLTPLMLACQQGNLKMVSYLIDNGAKVEARDRFKRTPLIHACMCGNAHIVSHLLRLGANANVVDSSMNSAMHYAMAYGWYYCVRLLIEAGVDLKCVNTWQTTCFAAGFLKGHFGLCDYLLNEAKVDINFKTEDGLTLVMLTVALTISQAVVQQLEYVVIKHKADCTIVDANGRNALHYLASNTTSFKDEENRQRLKTNLIRMSEILFEHGSNPNQMDNKAQTPLMIALECGNFILVDYFLNELKLNVTADVSSDGKTLLHYFAMKSHENELIQTLFHLPINDDLIQMGQMFDEQGRTPFHYVASKFDEFCRTNSTTTSSNVDLLKKQYESIVKMIEFCLEIIQCDPDVEIRTTNKNKEGDDDEDESEENDGEKTIGETSVFSLLRTVAFINASMTHPLEYFLKKTKNLNVLHHRTRRTALLEAIHLQECRTSQLLLKESLCDVNLASSIESNERGQTPLIVACRLQFLPIIDELLNHSKCDLLIRDERNNQAFHYFLSTSQRSNECIEKFHLFVQKLLIVAPQSLNNPGQFNRTPLHIAVYHNSGSIDTTIEIEQTLIDRKCSLTNRDDLGNVPLHNVFLPRNIADDPVELCVLLLKSMQNQSIDLKNHQGNTPFFYAVNKCSTVCITLLQKHKADVNVENDLGNTIIGNCIVSGHLNLLIHFLSQQMKIDLSKIHTIATNSIVEQKSVTSTSNSTLTFGKAPRRKLGSSSTTSKVKRTKKTTKNEMEKKIDRWFWKYVDPKRKKQIEQYSLIHFIVQQDWQGALSLILNELDRFHLKLIQILESAIFNKKLNLVYRLLIRNRDRLLNNDKNVQGQNLFHLLANIDQFDSSVFIQILNYLFEHRLVDWNLTDKHGSTPLHYACVQQNFLFIDFLQEKYSIEFTLSQTDAFGNTALGLLFWSMKPFDSTSKSKLQSLITSGEQLNCLINYNNESAVNPLSFGYTNELMIKDSSFYPPLKSENGSTTARTSPLIHAIVQNQFDWVKFLLELGADVNFTDDEKRTPLMHAVRQNNFDMVKVLLNKSYSPKKSEENETNSTKRVRKQSKTPRFLLGVTENVVETMTNEIEPLKPFEITSSIDLNAKDALGRTAIHHLVQPFPDGSYVNNIEMLELLYNFGASVTKHDLAGLTPLQYGTINGCQHLCDALIRLSGEKKDETSVPIEQRHPNDPNTKLLDATDFYADAQNFIETFLSKTSSNKKKRKIDVYEVDPLSKMSQTGEVVIDEEKNQPFDVRLTRTDVGYGLIGFYNFYRMQIIQHKSKTNLFFLFTRWGRIGDGEGQYQMTPFSTLDECRKEFSKVFREKTGNLWKDVEQFQSKPKKYTLIPWNEREIQKHVDVSIDFQRLLDENEQIPSKLQSEVYKTLFKTWIHPQVIRQNVKKTHLDIEWMPVSQLKRSSLDKAREILQKLKSDIEKKEKLRLENRQSKTIDQSVEIKQILDSIYRHTNEFYSIVPLHGYAEEKLPMIDHERILKEKEQILDDIFQLELSYKMLLGAQANFEKISPYDYLYKSIHCHFEAMNKDDMDSQLILRYIWTSSPDIEVEQIFKIARPSEDQRLNDRKLTNHYLLWHGTNICNLISVLTRGLLVGSLTANSTGNLFGKGIYTSDAFAKSLNYCSGVVQNESERCFMILCEVALGQIKETNNNNRPQDDDDDDDVTKPLDLTKYQSRKGNGRSIPDPRYTITRNCDVQMPLGQLIPNPSVSNCYSSLPYNEYIVYDEAQVALRYLVQFRR